jgi:hypothetical protein
MDFPHYQIWKLKDWIDPSQLDWEETIYEYFVEDYSVSLIEKNKDKYEINWNMLSSMSEAMPILEKNLDKINWKELCRNKGAIHLLKKNINKINWNYLSTNPSAIDFLEENIDHINWEYLHQNPKGAKILLKYQDKIDLSNEINPDCLIELYEGNIEISDYEDDSVISFLSRSTSNIRFLEEHIDKVNWYELSKNPHAIPILEKNIDKIFWKTLCLNTSAIHLIEQNLGKIFGNKDSQMSWIFLSSNKNAIHLIEQNLKGIEFDSNGIPYQGKCKLNWSLLSSNESAMHILEKYPEKIDYIQISANISIFELDYDFLTRRMNMIREELMEKALHPSRLENWILPI